jgi:hypothetical protein
VVLPASFGFERSAHLGEQTAADARDDVHAEARLDAGGAQPAGRRVTVAHLHLDARRDRDVAAGIGDHAQFLVGAGVAVDVDQVGAE